MKTSFLKTAEQAKSAAQAQCALKKRQLGPRASLCDMHDLLFAVALDVT